MNVEPEDEFTPLGFQPTPNANTLALLAYGARGNWDDTVKIINDIHAYNNDAIARSITIAYQMIEHIGDNAVRQRIGRSLARLGHEEYAAIRVADVLLDHLAASDVVGFADAWDGVRFAFGGRNVVPVVAATLVIILGALEPEDKDADMLLDRHTADGSFYAVLRAFGYNGTDRE